MIYPAAVDDFARYHDRVFRCIKVVDGDTIDIDIADLKGQHRAYTRLRLWGIDTPELPHHGQTAMCFAYEAAEFARKLLQGKPVRLELIKGRTRGHYGRVLAYVYTADGQLYNHEAVKQGFAYAETRQRYSLHPHPLMLHDGRMAEQDNGRQ